MPSPMRQLAKIGFVDLVGVAGLIARRASRSSVF